jgi:hypothetical protein
VSKRPRLKRRQIRAIAEYVAELQENLRLCGWHLEVMDGPPPRRDSNATTWVARQAHEADIYIDPVHFPRLSRSKQRQVLVHELCHLIVEPFCQVVGATGMSRGKGREAKRVADSLVDDAMERMNDDFAWLLAEHQPLPPRGWLD